MQFHFSSSSRPIIIDDLSFLRFNVRTNLSKTEYSMKPYFIFDFDASALRKNYTHLLVLMLVEMGLIPKIALMETNKCYRAYVNRSGSYEDFLKALLRIICEQRRFEGIRLTDMERVCVRLAKRSGHLTHVFWEALFRATKEEGYGTLIITGSPVPAVRAFAEARGVDHYHGTTFKHDGSTYTGEYDDSVARFKGSALMNFIEKNNVASAQSIVLGDAMQDLSMLKCVAFPIVINPTRDLYTACRTDQIPIIHEKRALIYADAWCAGKRFEADLEQILPLPVAKRVKELLGQQLCTT
jgi:phosphoserine phosphatase